MPYRVAGTVMHDGVSKVVLVNGNAVVAVQAGEALEGGYRVEAIGPDEIVLLYLPLGVRERLSMISTAGVDAPAGPPARSLAASSETASAGAGSRPAQVRWEGPERVQAGNNFDLTLKVTSEEPLRASPLQVSFDAQVLKVVAVRPGKFFGGGALFSYRINPGGSIFVGASGSGSIASDAELVIFTFRPIRPDATAEVKISSLQLHDAVGKSIAVEPIPAYRTSIAP
jgi:hypothetical protein